MLLFVRMPVTPDYKLSPNAQVHWGTRKKLRAAAREMAARYLQQAFTPADLADFANEYGDFALEWQVFWQKGHKIMDQDNLIASLKGYQDGLADALHGVDDKRFTRTTVEQFRDPEGKGFMQVLIRPI